MNSRFQLSNPVRRPPTNPPYCNASLSAESYEHEVNPRRTAQCGANLVDHQGSTESLLQLRVELLSGQLVDGPPGVHDDQLVGTATERLAQPRASHLGCTRKGLTGSS